ncbi:conserved hypothetical protein [Vibrio crassostreae]|uniref:hypothetical protein n=1 Tax=Vibrio crassostreae TaxID=246167 RepID=UPI001BD4ED6B|nr:hypothetical protein [Vibrio crassostreae]CAK2110017.1 conserved hypothetical protein [Vibrio crassostreae]CAK2118833.1 conserved hypothetical protein [Vibrio crassostreae]CAK2363992.1 conserved hypothetical protein [Vibrio crassostreae]CAK2365488.1 conserved hypothetical protein [Vibrio crassostreae]CAK2371157.1 conserved hypothetical protein [Vibrio crassostreae]
MADIATISALLGSIKTATDLAKVIKNSSATLEQAEIKMQFAELIGALADAKMELSDLQVELAIKDQEIKKLELTLAQRRSVVWEKPYYWVTDNDKKDGPFCAQCYDSSEKLIRLQGGGNCFWRCKTCNCTFKDKHYVEPPIGLVY